MGDIRQKLVVDSTEWVRGMDRANAASKSFEKVALAAFTGVVAGITSTLTTQGIAALRGFTDEIKASFADIDRLSKTSRSLGLAVSELQALEHHASLAGAEIGALPQMMAMLIKSVPKQGSLLSSLGLDPASLATASPVRMLDQIADALAKIPPGQQRIAAATALAGRQWQTLLRITEGGSAALRAAADDAAQLGLNLTDAKAEGVEKFNDSMTRMGALLKAMAGHAAAELAPALEHLVTVMTDFGQTNDLVDETTDAFRGLARMIDGSAIALDYLIDRMVDLGVEAARHGTVVAVLSGEMTVAQAQLANAINQRMVTQIRMQREIERGARITAREMRTAEANATRAPADAADADADAADTAREATMQEQLAAQARADIDRAREEAARVSEDAARAADAIRSRYESSDERMLRQISDLRGLSDQFSPEERQDIIARMRAEIIGEREQDSGPGRRPHRFAAFAQAGSADALNQIARSMENAALTPYEKKQQTLSEQQLKALQRLEQLEAEAAAAEKMKPTTKWVPLVTLPTQIGSLFAGVGG